MAGILAAAIAAHAEDVKPRVYNVGEGALSYSVVHKLHEVRGTTHTFEGKVVVAPDGTARVQVRARVATFDGGNSNRDEHMREVAHETEHPYCSVKGTASGIKLPLEGSRRSSWPARWSSTGSASLSRSRWSSFPAGADSAPPSPSPSVSTP